MDNKVELQVVVKDGASGPLRKVAGAMDAIDPAAGRAGAASDAALDSMYRRGMKASEAAQSISEQLKSVQQQVLGLVGLDFGSGMVIDLAATADEFKNLESRIRLVVGANGDVAGTMAAVKDVAQETFTSLDATTQLFTRLAASAKELGLTQQDALETSRTINQAIQVSGASAQASEAAVRQLVQGLQSGVLRGDEFNSVMEQAPRLAKALADGLGLPTGALRGLAEQGKLTSAEVVRALRGQREAIEAEFTQLPLTVGRAVQNLQTEFTSFVGLLDGTTGASSLAAEGIQALADRLDTLARVAGAAGAAMTAALAVQGVAALRAMSGSAALLTADLAKIPKIISISVAAVGFEVGFQLGEMLRENFVLARQLGAGVVGFFEQVFNDLRFLKEAAEAIFTSDTIGAAFDRYVQRNKEIAETIGLMMKDAEQAPQAVAEAANQASGAADKAAQAAQRASTALNGVATAGNETAAALKDIGKDFDLSDAMGVAKAVTHLRELVNTSQITADQFRERWSKALAGADLFKFQQDAQLAFSGVVNGVQLLSDAMDAGLREAIRRSGGEFEVLAGGMGRAARSAVNDVDTIINGLDRLKAQGVDVGQALALSLGRAIKTADSQAAIEALRSRVQQVRQQLGDQVADGLLKQIEDQASKATGALSGLDSALKKLGITSDTELKKAANEARGLYEEVLKAGGSAREQAAAFERMAAAAIASGDAGAQAYVRAQAAAQGFEVAADAAGKTVVRSMTGGTAATDGLAQSLQRANEALERQIELANKQVATTAKRFSRPGEGSNDPNDPGPGSRFARPGDPKPTNSQGQTQAEYLRSEKLAGQAATDERLRFELLDKLRAGTVAEGDLQDLFGVVQALKTNQRIFDSLPAGASSLQALADDRKWQQAVVGFEQAISRLVGGSGAEGAQPIGRTVNVNLNTGGGRRETVRTDAEGADALVRALEQSALRAR